MRSARDKPKTNPPFPTKSPFNRKVNKSKIIEALIHQYLILEEDFITEDDTGTKDPIEQDTSILVKSTTAKITNPTDSSNLISTIYKKIPNSKTKINKASNYEKELEVDGFYYRSVRKIITHSTSKANRVCNHSLIDRGESGGVAG